MFQNSHAITAEMHTEVWKIRETKLKKKQKQNEVTLKNNKIFQKLKKQK